MRRIESLDGLRAIAVGSVIASHLLAGYGIDAGNLGWGGVYVFFAISGYVITRTLVADDINLRRFYIRRAFRILPAMWLYLAVVYALGFAGFEVLPAAAFLCNTRIAGCTWNVAHTWSLAFEEQFYLVYPALLAALLLRRRLPWLIVPAVLFAVLPFVFPIHWIGRRGFVEVYALLGMGAFFAFHPVRVPRFLTRPLELAPLPYIGRISYSLYLWQQLFTGESVPVAWHPAGVAAAIVISMASFHAFERLFQENGRRLAARQGLEGPRPSGDPEAGLGGQDSS